MDTSAFNFDDAEQMYDVIPALRALAIRDKQPETWKLFWNLMSHLDNWMKDPEWKVSHQYIIDFILDKLKVILLSLSQYKKQKNKEKCLKSESIWSQNKEYVSKAGELKV